MKKFHRLMIPSVLFFAAAAVTLIPLTILPVTRATAKAGRLRPASQTTSCALPAIMSACADSPAAARIGRGSMLQVFEGRGETILVRVAIGE